MLSSSAFTSLQTTEEGVEGPSNTLISAVLGNGRMMYGTRSRFSRRSDSTNVFKTNYYVQDKLLAFPFFLRPSDE